jgi:hypothetical protein
MSAAMVRSSRMRNCLVPGPALRFHHGRMYQVARVARRMVVMLRS